MFTGASKFQETEDMKKAEIFQIPFRGKVLIYAPLKRIAFIGNKALAQIVTKLSDGKKIDYSSQKALQAAKFVESIGLMSPDPEIPNNETNFHYQPIFATLFLTNRCNFRCIYCYANGGELPSMDMSVELATQSIDIVCDNAIESGLTSFNLCFHGGGEPTLNWKSLMTAVAHARKKPIKVNISASSNGCYTKEKLSYILNNFDGLSLSFDGPPEIQNIQRPMAGGCPSFSSVMKTIEAMDKISFPYGIRMTTTALSVKKLPQILEFLSNNTKTKLIQIEPAFPQGRGKETAIVGKFADIFIKAFIEAYELASSKGIRLLYSGLRLNILTKRFCMAPCNALIVLPTGEISSCFEIHNVNHPLANDFIFGRIQNGRLYFDEKRWHDTISCTIENISYCMDCFCKYHCAGDCLTKSFHRADGTDFKPSFRCKINRELTKHFILKEIAKNNGIWIERM